jgi:hypothetical protein
MTDERLKFNTEYSFILQNDHEIKFMYNKARGNQNEILKTINFKMNLPKVVEN